MQNILLAAGLGERSEGKKLLLPYKNQSIIAHSVEQSLQAGLHTIVVTGFRNVEIEAELARFSNQDLIVTYNESYATGQGSSTLCGARLLNAGEDFFISLADMPLLEARHYLYLSAAWKTADGLRPVHQGRVGHPVLLKAFFKEIILQQEQTFTMRSLLSSYTIQKCSVDDEAYVYDIDTLHSYEQLLGRT